VQRLRIHYAKRGRLRFTSHRDFQRAFERALRRAGVPMAYSAGFSPHPKISYVGASPTGVASEAEYLEIAVTSVVDPEELRSALDEALPAGLDVVEVVAARGGSLAERVEASAWRIVLAGVPAERARAALATFLAAPAIPVVRALKDGTRTLDARAAVVLATVVECPETRPAQPGADAGCAILNLVVRHLTPAVRPDDVLAGLRQVADLVPPVPPSVSRLAQGLLDASDPSAGRIADPLAPDRGAEQAADVAGAPLPR
jgi:radical SAM-linked protein